MPARRPAVIRPATALTDALETTRIRSVTGRTGDRTALVTALPCRARLI